MTASGQPAVRSGQVAGLLLIAAAGAGTAIANSALATAYHRLLEARLGLFTLHQWIADGLMALFFLLVGLEVKREWLCGRLASPAGRKLPILAAASGMAVPAIIFLAVTGFDPVLAPGWAIPAATDIAFALGVLALLGPRAPPAIKVLLVAVAIIDDIGAVVIIALAYTQAINGAAIGLALVILTAMATMNLFGVRNVWPYLIGFLLLWVAVHESGVHATIAGVLAALTIPLGRNEERSPLRTLEHRLHPWVMLGILPLFGFVSAGVTIDGASQLLQPLPIGVAMGLFLGKQLGVFGAVWLADRSGIAPKPAGVGWSQLYGAAMLCGIGFTMSLFIGGLAFPGQPELADEAKLGTMAGSILSAIAGALVLRLAAPATPPPPADQREWDAVFAGSDEH